MDALESISAITEECLVSSANFQLDYIDPAGFLCGTLPRRAMAARCLPHWLIAARARGVCPSK